MTEQITYPEQSPYVKGKKIWLKLPNNQRLVVSAQAREVLKWAEVDEKKFIKKLKELFAECFTNTFTKEGWVFSFENCSVSKATSPDAIEFEEGYGKEPHIKIEFSEFAGRGNTSCNKTNKKEV
jgi:hypothetical protein